MTPLAIDRASSIVELNWARVDEETPVSGVAVSSADFDADFRDVGSSCIAERRGIEIIDRGAPETSFMRFGDRVRMEARAADGGLLFGVIEQEVVPAEKDHG